MKFGQLIVRNIRNIFSEKSYTKCDRETSPRPFSENYAMPSWRLSEYIETKLQTTFFTSY